MRQSIRRVLPIVIFVLFSIPVSIFSAATPTVVKGRVFIDDIQTKPDTVQLLLGDGVNTATLYEDGSYIVVSTVVTPGAIGTFSILYQSRSYSPIELLTLEQDVSLYEIDLHINTSEETTESLLADPGGPYRAFVGSSVQFDGTGSIAPNGTIVTYAWEFGDTATTLGVRPVHTYSDAGNYTVTLTVTDNEGQTMQRSTYAVITTNPNFLPISFQLSGPTTGNIQTPNIYTIQLLSSPDESIQFFVNWSDDTSITITELVQNTTPIIVDHSWMTPGIYSIYVYARDQHNHTSEVKELTVLINTLYVGAIGYLSDLQSDGIYDRFYSNTTGYTTMVSYSNNIYLLDSDNDGTWDTQYNSITGQVSSYSAEQSTGVFLPSTILLLLIAFVVIFIAVLVLWGSSKKTKNAFLKMLRRTPVDNLPPDKRTVDTATIDDVLSKKLPHHGNEPQITTQQSKEPQSIGDATQTIETSSTEIQQQAEEPQKTTESVPEDHQKTETLKITDEQLQDVPPKKDEQKDADEQSKEKQHTDDASKINEEKIKNIRKKIDDLLQDKE